jgi:hypothetical protein
MVGGMDLGEPGDTAGCTCTRSVFDASVWLSLSIG